MKDIRTELCLHREIFISVEEKDPRVDEHIKAMELCVQTLHSVIGGVAGGSYTRFKELFRNKLKREMNYALQ